MILPLLDVRACEREVERLRAALESGWAKVPGLISACFAFLPRVVAEPTPAALLFECSFESELAELSRASFLTLGSELSAVLEHCEGYPKKADARQLFEYLSARARRSFAWGDATEPRGITIAARLWRVFDAVSTPSAEPTPTNPEALEARRLALGLQDPNRGVPLVHVAWLVPGSYSRVKRALRELDCEPSLIEHAPRFLLDGSRLVFVAYPSENAQRWSERLSQAALGSCSRIWRNSRDFPRLIGARRARRERRLQEFVIEHRVPVAAWFNAWPLQCGTRRES